MRVTGGRLRGRRLAVPAGRTVRPTTDRVREALFNSLTHAGLTPDGGWPAAAPVLDVFAGSGALGIEALSRGAGRCVFIEHNPVVRRTLAHNLHRLGLTARADILARDATRPGPATLAANLVFLDPPYGPGLIPDSLTACTGAGWLAPAALVMAEAAASETLTPPPGFHPARPPRRYGHTAIHIWRREP